PIGVHPHGFRSPGGATKPEVWIQGILHPGPAQLSEKSARWELGITLTCHDSGARPDGRDDRRYERPVRPGKQIPCYAILPPRPLTERRGGARVNAQSPKRPEAKAQP